MKNLITDNRILNKSERQQRSNEILACLMMAVCVACLPEMAIAQAADNAGDTIGNVVTSLTDLLQGTLARGVAVLFCVGMGFAAWAGKLSWKMAGNFIAGIVLIFGAASFVALFEEGG